MGQSLSEILHPKRIIEVFSQVNEASTQLSRLFGWNIGGSNVLPFGGRDYNYDVFDHTRTVADGRVPGAQRARTKPQLVKTIHGVFPRSAEEIPLLWEKMINLRQIGGPVDVSNLSASAESYITHQEVYLAERFANIIEFQTAAMLRGSYTYTIDGDDLIHDFSGGDFTVDYDVPSGNKSKLNMTGGGNIITASWATAGTNIPLHIFNIDKAMQELTGDRLEHILVGTDVWNNIINNDFVQEQAGTANMPMQSINQLADANFVGLIRSVPWVQFHIINAGLEVGTTPTFTTLIADNHASFIPAPSPSWAQYIQGSEVVVEENTKTVENRMGTYAWSYDAHDPAGHQLAAVHNGIPALKRPDNVADGLVVF